MNGMALSVVSEFDAEAKIVVGSVVSGVVSILRTHVVVEADGLYTSTPIMVVDSCISAGHEGSERPLEATVFLAESEALRACCDHAFEVTSGLNE